MLFQLPICLGLDDIFKMLVQESTLQELVKNIAMFINNFDEECSLQQQLIGHPLIQKLRKIKRSDLQLPLLQQHKNKIAERTLYDQHGLRISLYYLSKGMVMPLHNHPQMMVIAFLLQGSVKVKLYSPTQKDMIFQKKEMKLTAKEFACIDGLRTMEYNLHQFQALEDTLILDILFPDYDQERDCSYFRQEKAISKTLWKLVEAQIKSELVQL